MTFTYTTNDTWVFNSPACPPDFTPTVSYEFGHHSYAKDADSETTGFCGPHGNDWVIKTKGIDNGIYASGHLYSCPGDLEGIEAANAIASGKFAKNATFKATKATFANDSDYECSPVVSYPAPTKDWDAEAVSNAVKTQVATFGKVAYGTDGCKTASKKAALKSAALDKSLNIAFGKVTQNGDNNNLYLDPGTDSSWTPVSNDPLDAMIEAEDTTTADIIAKAKSVLTPDQWAMVVAKANGKTQKEIAADQGITHQAVSLKFKTIEKKVLKATGVACVA